MLNSQEVIAINNHLLKNHNSYLAASEHVRRTCLDFKTQRPQVLRVVFQREPPVKTPESVIAKIELMREKNKEPAFSVEDLYDIVALTVLCPYQTDVAEFVRWMKTAFQVVTPDEDARRDYRSGHRALHYVVSAIPSPATFQFADVKCELQVKTILQEAFDAKSHDLAYKPKKVKISEELKEQFALFSTSLKAVDGQSEFLKNLILRDKQEVAYRREACLLLYFEQDDVKKMAAALGLDVANLPDVMTLARVLQEWVKKNGLSRELCKLAALCAIKHDADYLRFEALRYADAFVKEDPKRAPRYVVRGAVKWLVGRCEAAILDVAIAIKMAESNDAVTVRQSKNNFVYFVADWKAYESSERDDFNAAAKTYVQELKANLDAKTTDTLGLYLIAFGETEDEVEEGRAHLRNARKLREEDPAYPSFFRLHEYIALRKLLDLAPRPKLQAMVSYV